MAASMQAAIFYTKTLSLAENVFVIVKLRTCEFLNVHQPEHISVRCGLLQIADNHTKALAYKENFIMDLHFQVF